MTQCTPSPKSRSVRRDLAKGETIAGRYLLLDLLGQGGMGSVWRARCLRSGVDVAVKLSRVIGGEPDAAERLRKEAEAARRVRHPSTVRVFASGTTAEGDPFLVMELLTGPSLAALRRSRGRLPELSAVRLLLPIASALAEAHENGVVHRDLKPENVVLAAVDDDDDTCLPKLIDFGVAKVKRELAEGPPSEAGLTLGSVGYMAPEQLCADPDMDASVDVWALAVVLYELIAGELPFEAQKPMRYLSSVMLKEPIPTTIAVSGDPALWAILSRGLRRSRADRWPSMAAFGRALASWAMTQGATTDVAGAPLAPWPRRRLAEDAPPESAPSAPARPLWDPTGMLRFL